MMFRKLILALAIISFGIETLAQGPMLVSDKNKLKFSVPVVSTVPTGPDLNNAVGSIVYDINAQGFKGLFQDGNWGPIIQGSVRSPKLTVITSSCIGNFETTEGALYMKVRLVGGGGGGSSGGTSTLNAGSDGDSTTFGTTLLVANGGKGAPISSTALLGGDGGTSSLALGISGLARSGDRGTPGMAMNTSYGSRVNGGNGGASPFLGAGVGGSFTTNTHVNARANTGSGGGGGGANGVNTDIYSGNGGGAGGYVEAIISSPEPSYPCTIGNGGAGGTGVGVGYSGGNGGSGVIEVTEYFQ